MKCYDAVYFGLDDDDAYLVYGDAAFHASGGAECLVHDDAVGDEHFAHGNDAGAVPEDEGVSGRQGDANA